VAARLVLVRHAHPATGSPGRLIGSTDLLLDEQGEAQARGLADRLARLEPECCFSSPLARCRQTAATIAGPLPVRLDPDLREIDFGRWENRTFADVAAAEPDLVARWAEYDPGFAFPGGESLEGFQARVSRVAGRLAGDPAGTVLVVSHAGTIRALVCHYLGLRPSQYVLFDVGYASITLIRLFDGRGVLATDAACCTRHAPRDVIPLAEREEYGEMAR
jgi:broad specificity phosphatase PhoE